MKIFLSDWNFVLPTSIVVRPSGLMDKACQIIPFLEAEQVSWFESRLGRVIHYQTLRPQYFWLGWRLLLLRLQGLSSHEEGMLARSRYIKQVATIKRMHFYF